MSTFVVADSDPINPPASIPFVEKDAVILRGVTKALLDFSNPETVAQGVALPLLTNLKNLVVGGAPATTSGPGGSAFPAVYNGTIRSIGAGDPGSGSTVILPSDFNLPETTQRFLSVIWLRAVKAGWPASSLNGVFGVGETNNIQQALWARAGADGVISSLQFRMHSRAAAAFIDCIISPGADLDSVFDGNLHQIGLAFEVSDGIGTQRIYRDGALLATASGATTGVRASAIKGFLFGAPAASASTGTGKGSLDTRIGRPQLHDLTSRPELAFTDILERDRNAANGYLG